MQSSPRVSTKSSFAPPVTFALPGGGHKRKLPIIHTVLMMMHLSRGNEVQAVVNLCTGQKASMARDLGAD